MDSHGTLGKTALTEEAVSHEAVHRVKGNLVCGLIGIESKSDVGTSQQTARRLKVCANEEK
jgi:hypothetical protein